MCVCVGWEKKREQVQARGWPFSTLDCPPLGFVCFQLHTGNCRTRQGQANALGRPMHIPPSAIDRFAARSALHANSLFIVRQARTHQTRSLQALVRVFNLPNGRPTARPIHPSQAQAQASSSLCLVRHRVSCSSEACSARAWGGDQVARDRKGLYSTSTRGGRVSGRRKRSCRKQKAIASSLPSSGVRHQHTKLLVDAVRPSSGRLTCLRWSLAEP